MAFGLCISPQTFQRYVSMIFQPLIKKGVLTVYLDDFLVPAKDEKMAVERLQRVLKIASEYGLNINWKKCKFLQRRTEFLGHTINNGMILPSDSIIKSVKNHPLPKTVVEVQRFLGMTGFVRKYIPYYSLIARPSTDLLKKDAKFHIGEKERAAFEELKQKLITKPVLAIFRYGAETEVHTDASKLGLAGILFQRDTEDGHMHPVRYWSRKTTQTEEKYHSYELEVTAVMEAVGAWRIYLLGNPFKIFTDCKASGATMKRNGIPKIARWGMNLQEYEYEVIHRPGDRMKHVDALSRMYFVRGVSLIQSLMNAQQADESILAIISAMNTQPIDGYMMQNGLLCKQTNGDIQIVVPEQMQYDIIRRAHERGHFKSTKMEVMIENEFHIPHMKKKIERVVRNCIKCILTDRKSGKQECLLNPIPKEGLPMDTLHLDHLGPMPSTNKNYKHILTVVDAFTKFCWIFPTKSTTASEGVQKMKLLSETFGNPRRIVADRGSAFTSNE